MMPLDSWDVVYYMSTGVHYYTSFEIMPIGVQTRKWWRWSCLPRHDTAWSALQQNSNYQYWRSSYRMYTTKSYFYNTISGWLNFLIPCIAVQCPLEPVRHMASSCAGF